jgi:cytochrome c oxidase subunit 3
MTIIVLFILGVIGFAAVWLSRQRLMSKPWLETGLPEYSADEPVIPTAKIGLGIFLVVVGALFALLTSAFVMRMEYSDWQQLTLPRIVWYNTAVLVLSSLCLRFAVQNARNGDISRVRTGLAGGGLSALGFLIGQILTLAVLVRNGQILGPDPAISFFYLLAGLHGLHIFGGLVALLGAYLRAVEDGDSQQLRLSVELCATYWHTLLIIWIAVVVLLLGWASELLDICRAIIS